MNVNAQKAQSYSKPVLFGLLVFCLLLALTQYLTYQKYLLSINHREEQLKDAANIAKSQLQTSLQHSLYTTKTLAFMVSKYGIPNDFDKIAKALMTNNKHINAVELVNARGVITHVYPLAQNKSIIGYNVLLDETRNKEAFKAIQRKELFYAGPFPLRQGGMGVVGREPIFQDGEFIGFAAVVIRLSTLIDATGIDPGNKKGFVYQLSKTNPDTKKEEFFLETTSTFDREDAIIVEVPHGEWNLYVKYRDNDVLMSIVPFGIAGLLISVLGGVIACYLLRKPEELSKRVKEKTTHLQMVLESISDGFVALDKDWNYTYINEKGAWLFDRHTAAGLVGRNLWQLFPHFREQPFFKHYDKVMKERVALTLFDYYEPWDKYFENSVYPSEDGGITIFCKDVTDTVRAEKEKRKSEEAIHKIMESSVDMICTIDENGRFLQVGAAAETILGYRPEELSGNHFSDFIHPDDLARSLAMAEFIALGNDQTNFENSYIKKDGTLVPLVWSARWDAKERLMYCSAKDATDREEAQKELQLSEQRFRILVQEGSDLIGVLDREGVYKYKSPSSETILGIPPEHFIGHNVFTFIHPDDLPRIQSEFDALGENERTTFSPLRFRHGNGSWRWLETTITDLTNHPAVNGIVTNSRDVTDNVLTLQALQQSEVRYRYLFDHNPQPMYIFSLDSNQILECNNRALQKYGYSREEFLNFTVTDIRPEEDRREFQAFMDAGMLFEPGRGRIWRHLKKDGSVMFVEITANRIEYMGISSALILVADVTEQLRHMQTVEKQNESLQEIAWIQSHVVRAPLARIMGLVDFLKNHSTTESEREELLSYILASTEEFDAIIRDIVHKADDVKHDIMDNEN